MGTVPIFYCFITNLWIQTAIFAFSWVSGWFCWLGLGSAHLSKACRWVHSLLTGELGAGGSHMASAGMTCLHSTCILDASPGELGTFSRRGVKMSPYCASPCRVPQWRQTTWLSAQPGWALRGTPSSPGTRPLWHQDQLAAGLGCIRRWESGWWWRRDGE